MFDGLKRMLGKILGGRQVARRDAVWRENMERSEEGLLIIRPPSQIVHANGAAGLLLGRKAKELRNSVFPYALTLGGLTSIVLPRGKEGPATLEAGAVTIAWEGAPAWLVTLRDVTVSHRLNSMQIERVKVLERMAQGVVLVEILVALVQFVESQYPQSICTVMLLDPDGIRLRYGASTRLPRPLIEVADKIRVGPGQGSCGTAAHERKAVIVSDIANSPLWAEGRDVALESGIRACWSIPIFSTSGDVIGTFATYYRTPREPATDEIDLVSACAQITGVAIERHRAEAQLKLLESSIAHVNDMVIITDVHPIDEPGPRMVFVNDALLRHTGYQREELLGKSPRVFQGPLTQRDQLDRIHDALAARQPVRAEVINYTSAGEQFWVELDITSISDTRGRATHFVSVQRDITDYKRIQEAMRRSDERFRLVARVTTDVIWDWNLLSGKLWWSEGIETLFGHKVPEAGADFETWANWLHLDDRERVVDGIHAVIDSGGQEWSDEYRFMRGDGSYAHVVDKGFVTHDKTGQPVRMVGGVKDVSERHAADADARRAAQTQALIVRAQRHISESNLDLDGVMQLIAQRAQELTGASGASVVTVEGDAFVYRAVSGLTHKHLGLHFSREKSLAAIAMRTGEPQICNDCEDDPRVDLQACRALGIRSVICVALNRQDIDRALLSVVSIRPGAFDARDLANLEILADSLGSARQRERDAQHLQASEANYRMLFENNPQPMLVYDVAALKLLAVNAAAIEHYGYSQETFLGLTIPELHPAEDVDRLQAYMESAPPRRRRAVRWRHQTSHGEIIDVEISSDELVFEGHSARLALVVDITHRLQGERELLRISRASLMLSRCNEAMIHAETEQELYDAMCRIGVETGGYRLAWVGLAMDDDVSSISHVACFGEGVEYLTGLNLSWSAHSEAGRGPSGRSIREGDPVVIEDIEKDPEFAAWAKDARRHGLRAMVCLPLRGGERSFGHLSFYSASTLPIGKGELKLLQELADNLTYGIEHLRVGIERGRLQEAVTRLATMVSSADGAFFFDELSRSMVEAVKADAGFIVRMSPTPNGPAPVIAAVVDGKCHRIAELTLHGAPRHVDSGGACVVADHLDLHFSGSQPFDVQGARAYVGQRLEGVDGRPVGLLFVLFRKPLRRPDFVVSTLGIFASRAGAELEQRAANLRIREQASLLDKTGDAMDVGEMNHRGG